MYTESSNREYCFPTAINWEQERYEHVIGRLPELKKLHQMEHLLQRAAPCSNRYQPWKMTYSRSAYTLSAARQPETAYHPLKIEKALHNSHMVICLGHSYALCRCKRL